MQVLHIAVEGSPGIPDRLGMIPEVQEGSLGNQGQAARCELEILGMAVQGIPEEGILEEGTLEPGIRELMEGGIPGLERQALRRVEAVRNSSTHWK